MYPAAFFTPYSPQDWSQVLDTRSASWCHGHPHSSILCTPAECSSIQLSHGILADAQTATPTVMTSMHKWRGVISLQQRIDYKRELPQQRTQQSEVTAPRQRKRVHELKVFIISLRTDYITQYETMHLRWMMAFPVHVQAWIEWHL